MVTRYFTLFALPLLLLAGCGKSKIVRFSLPNDSSIGSPQEAGDLDLRPAWDSLSRNVFAPKCFACHSAMGQARFLDLSSRDAIYTNRNRVFDGGKKFIDLSAPFESYLLSVLTDTQEPMPPKWSGIRPLNAAELRVVEQWIAAGIP